MKKNYSIIVSLLILILSFAININGLSREAIVALGIFFASLNLWIFLSIDWPSILSIFLIGLLPSIGFNKALSSAFGNSTVLFLLFTFILVYPLSKTNFIRKVSLFFITNKIAKKNMWTFTIFLLFSVYLLGLFISPSVLFVAFIPFLEDIFKVLNIKKGSKFGNMLMMGSAFIISLSSGATPIGHVWPTLALSAYTGATGKSINVLSYMIFGIITSFILFIILILIFRFIYKPEKIIIDNKNVIALKNKLYKNKNFIDTSYKEKVIIIVLLITIILWILPSMFKNIFPDVYNIVNSYTTAMPPMLGCIILFLIKDNNKSIINFDDAMKNGVVWGAIFMTAAATLVGSILTNASLGINQYVSNFIEPIARELPLFLTILLFTSWTIIETNFSSNIVTTTLVTSIAIIVLSNNQIVSLPAICSIIGFSAAICNMTPAGQSTINTVAISSGYTNAKSMFVWGGIFALFSIIIISTIGYWILYFLL